jgi:hypothetical protein
MKSLRSIFTIILVLTLITAQVGATCPATWNDPSLSCITTTNWHDFVNNWTFWNTSTWSNFNNYATILLLNSVNQSQTNNLTAVNGTIQGQISGLATTVYVNAVNLTQTNNLTAVNNTIQNQLSNYATTSFVNSVNATQNANVSAVNTSIRALLPNYLLLSGGTMTGQINAGGINISNVLSPVVSTDVATKGYVDSHATPPSPNTIFSALPGSQEGNIAVWNGTSARWLNDSGYTIPSLIAAVPIVNSSYATTTYVNSVNQSQTNNLTAVNSTIWSNIGTWNTVAATSASLTVNNGYIPTSATRTQFTLPVSASPGQSEKITGSGSGGWVINQNTGQTIYFAGSVNTTPGTAGNVTSNTAYDSISLRCVVTNTSWVAELFTGNLQVN